MRLLILAASCGTACTDKSIPLGGGEPADARLHADVYTWVCEDSASERYEGESPTS